MTDRQEAIRRNAIRRDTARHLVLVQHGLRLLSQGGASSEGVSLIVRQELNAPAAALQRLSSFLDLMGCGEGDFLLTPEEFVAHHDIIQEDLDRLLNEATE